MSGDVGVAPKDVEEVITGPGAGWAAAICAGLVLWGTPVLEIFLVRLPEVNLIELMLVAWAEPGANTIRSFLSQLTTLNSRTLETNMLLAEVRVHEHYKSQ